MKIFWYLNAQILTKSVICSSLSDKLSGSNKQGSRMNAKFEKIHFLDWHSFGHVGPFIKSLKLFWIVDVFMLEVGYTGVKKGDVSNSLGLPCIWCSMISWKFWHIFLMKIGWKMREYRPPPPQKKTIFEVGVWGGHEKYFFLQILVVSSALMTVYQKWSLELMKPPKFAKKKKKKNTKICKKKILYMTPLDPPPRKLFFFGGGEAALLFFNRFH